MNGSSTKKDPPCPPMYRLGDVIYRSEPWVYSVLQETAPFACYRCLRSPTHHPSSADHSATGLENKPPLRRCAQCKLAHYCSEQCQKEDWTDRHQPECKILSKLGFHHENLSLDVLLILLKIIINLKRGLVGDTKGASFPPSTRTFTDLMSHEDELKRNPGVAMLYNAWKPYVALLDKDRTICPDFDAFVRLYGRFHTNGFSIADYFSGNIGKGLYLAPSVIDHSCDPNAVQFFVGKTLVIKAVRDIASLADEAQKCAVQCGSKTCKEPIPLFLHAKTDPKSYVCAKCGEDNRKRMSEARALTVKLVNVQVRKVGNSVGGQNKEDVSVMEKLAKQARGLLHPTNFLYGLLLRDLYSGLSAEGQKERAIAYLQMALLPLSVHVHPYESASTEALSEIINYHMEKRQFKEAAEALTKLVRRLKIVPGEDSEVFKEYQGMLTDCLKSAKNV